MADTHDYTKPGWGHDYTTSDHREGGKYMSMMGWGHGLKPGDYLILPNGETTTRYRLAEVEYFDDPSDMWKAEAVFAPRPTEGENQR